MTARISDQSPPDLVQGRACSWTSFKDSTSSLSFDRWVKRDTWAFALHCQEPRYRRDFSFMDQRPLWHIRKIIAPQAPLEESATTEASRRCS